MGVPVCWACVEYGAVDPRRAAMKQATARPARLWRAFEARVVSAAAMGKGFIRFGGKIR